MPETMPFPDTAEKASSIAEEVKNTLSDASAKVKEKASEFGRASANSIDSSRTSVANSLENAAASLEDHAFTLPGGERVTSLAFNAADKLGATAEYVRTHDTKAMMGDVEAFVKSHPGQSLLAAAVVGFLAGRAFQTRD